MGLAMKFGLLAVAILSFAWPQGAQDQKLQTYTEPYAGMVFDYPADWKITKKEKDRVIFAIPVAGSTEPAELQVVHTEFHADKDLFQTVQVRINEQLGRTVVRQWEQEVLGVPLLFSRIDYTDKDGIARSSLTGLFYTKTLQKVLFRLDMRQADYDSVTYVFDQAMQTLRTVDGKAPQPDDPSYKFEDVPKKPEKVLPPPKIIDDGNHNGAPVKPTGSFEATISERKVKLLFPEGWTAEKAEDGKISLTHADLTQPVVVTLYYTLDSDPPKRALYKASSASLSRYLTVDSREDKEDIKNRAGTIVSTTWRLGKSDKGDLVTYYSSGLAGDYYFLATYEQPSLPAYRSERRLIEGLVDQMTIEAEP
jgi:hypothetical protein